MVRVALTDTVAIYTPSSIGLKQAVACGGGTNTQPAAPIRQRRDEMRRVVPKSISHSGSANPVL
jgi:hypothetical protein